MKTRREQQRWLPKEMCHRRRHLCALPFISGFGSTLNSCLREDEKFCQPYSSDDMRRVAGMTQPTLGPEFTKSLPNYCVLYSVMYLCAMNQPFSLFIRSRVADSCSVISYFLTRVLLGLLTDGQTYRQQKWMKLCRVAIQ